MQSSIALDTIQSSKVVVDTIPQVNLNTLSSTTSVPNRTDIPTHILQTAIRNTAVLDRTQIQAPIFQTENNKTDNNSITSDIVLLPLELPFELIILDEVLPALSSLALDLESDLYTFPS